MEEEYEISRKIEFEYKCKIIKNNDAPYTLYLAKDIGKIINISNIRNSILNYNEHLKVKMKNLTNGGEQAMTFLTYEGLKRIISTSRTIESIDFAKKIGIDIYKYKFTNIESETIDCIIKAFSGYDIVTQYTVFKYRIDLYFIDYKIAIECDEFDHKYQKEYDKKREDEIKNALKCEFIRYNPHDPNFNIFSVINQILKKIYY